MHDDRNGRTAIYARYSTDLQNDRSIDDQVALCRAYAARETLIACAVYDDRAQSSSTIHGRHGLQRMLADAEAGRFSAILVEALDRISRDQADLATIYKRLAFCGVRLITVAGGEASELEVGVQGLLGQLWLAQNKAKIRRGMRGVIADGRNAGGVAYGYTTVPGRIGELAIDPAQARVIRRIFADYLAGHSPRAIAGALNSEGIAPPRAGGLWNASTINGQPARGIGILNNDLYRGQRVWNRLRMVVHPDTGRRVSRANPPDEWVWAPAPDLRIVDDATWAAVRARRRDRRGEVITARNPRRPKRVFSGLLRCGCCGGGMAVSTTRGTAVLARCSRARESGGCAQRRQVRLDRVEAAVMASLAETLRDPIYVEEYLAAYRRERRALATADAGADPGDLARRASQAAAAYQRAVDLYTRGVTDGAEAEATIRALLTAKRAAENARDEAVRPAPVVALHQPSRARYMDALQTLGATGTESAPAETLQAIRQLIDTVTVSPDGAGWVVDVTGHIAALIGNTEACGFPVVAEEGFEPPTQGL